MSAHIYRQTDLWWNFKEIIYISPPLNRCMKFSSTMKHTKKYILSQINQPELHPCNWLWSAFSPLFVSVFTYPRLFFLTSSANSSRLREDSVSACLTGLLLKGLSWQTGTQLRASIRYFSGNHNLLFLWMIIWSNFIIVVFHLYFFVKRYI